MSDRIVEVVVGWQSSSRRRPALEGCGREIARLRVDPRCILTLPVARRTVAADAEALIKRFATACVSRQWSDVTLLRRTARQLSGEQESNADRHRGDCDFCFHRRARLLEVEIESEHHAAAPDWIRCRENL